uniref:Predicted protein n=1 Tax=Hordeum vulgare subsp. vulgare TaxID=112509 RepID=F2DUW6_HORVV|nr:predicted protein [Hordeum vulgare subsp. vulgare]
MSGASAGAGAGPSSPALRLRGEDGRAEWLRFYDRVEAQVEALATDRAHLGATRGEGEEAILPADRLAELQEGDLEDAKVCRGLLTLRNTESDSEEIQDRPELGEKTRDHEQSVKAFRANLRELKGVFETLMSQKDKDVYSVKDVLFNQLRTMEKDKMLFENKKSEAAQAIEEAKKLQQNVQALHTTAQNKDDEIVRLQAEALVAQQKLHEMGSLLKEKDEVIEKLRAENIGLLAVKDFVWSQFQIKEQEYAILLKNKEVAAAQATEATQKLVKENRKMEAEVVDYGNKLLIIEDKLKEMGCLAKEKDDEIQELKNHQPEITSLKRKCASSLSNETSKKRMMDIIGMHITCIGRCKSGRLCFGHRMITGRKSEVTYSHGTVSSKHPIAILVFVLVPTVTDLTSCGEGAEHLVRSNGEVLVGVVHLEILHLAQVGRAVHAHLDKVGAVGASSRGSSRLLLLDLLLLDLHRLDDHGVPVV